ncbi:FtsX-like permease family protein [Sunxiuqinia sp. A32]|uniref:FtsX-like permease family protein n=1 Tax=Sunxiuqinia sp. A32 TaxID=3461496 RepID=UPI00404530CB
MTLINYLLRTVKKNKLDFFLNLIGLSVAMVVFIFVTMYVQNEVTFDSYHKNADRIFRITTSLTSPAGQATDMALANPPFVQFLKDECPEIEEFACVETEGSDAITYNENEYKNLNIREATPSIFKLFSYPSILGNSSNFLTAPNTIVLTESLSKNIFGKSSPIGEKLTIGKKDYEVTGVIADLPTNTDLQFSALIPSDFNGTGEIFDWGDYYVYIQSINSDVSGLNSKIERITDEKYTDLLSGIGGFKLVHHLQPLKNIHFENTLLADTPKGNKANVYIFSVVALLILLIAGINYTNLSLAQLEKRDREFSIRKTIGCGKRWIFYHIIGESILNVLIASAISLILSIFLLSYFNELFAKKFDIISILKLILPLLSVFLAFGILTGIYPAFKTTKTTTNRQPGFGMFGKSLVTFQNVIAIVMIAGLFMIWNQVHYMRNADLGFDKEQLLAISLPQEPEKFPGKEVLRQEFSSIPEISGLAFGGGGTILGNTGNWMKTIMAVKDETGNEVQFVLNQPQIDEKYIELFGIELLKGRNFSTELSKESEEAVIINESYAGIMGWDDPIGKILDETPKQKIVGLAKNFHFDALNNPIEPLKFRLLNGNPSYLFAKINPRDIPAIQQKWESIFSDQAFEFQFMDQHMASLYQKNETEMTIFSYLTIIAILISCLGLYGLASHFISNRTKEIGIRKVNGAKIEEVMAILNKGFIKWILIAFVIATPIAYYAMNKWLENFAYKTTLSWWIFALAGLLALGIALLTVSWQSWKAATRNPVEALRYE